jgi:hypothetical protein
MIEHVLDHMEKEGVVFYSSEELAKVTEGVRLFLLENGIPEHDTRTYFKQYLDRTLARVDSRDLKIFFIAYPIISEVNQICMEFKAEGVVSENRKTDLLNRMASLCAMGLGNKYVPSIEVEEILKKAMQDKYQCPKESS